MNSLASGFLTGFFNTQSDEMEVRRQEARDYFNKQVEMARTVGVANKRRVDAAVNESVTVARKLEAMGVPKDIIMAQANMDPASLGELYNQVVELSTQSSVPLTEDIYREIYKMSGDFAAPDEDFNTFFTRMFNPIVDASKNDPEGLKNDPKGTIWANAFGFNQMDKARAKLGETEVAPGLTAEEAIQYGDQVVPNRPYGNSTVVMNPQKLQEIAPADPITPSEGAAISKEYEDALTEARIAVGQEAGVDAMTPELEEQAKIQAYTILYSAYGGDEKLLGYIREKYGINLDAPVEAVGEPTEGGEDVPAPDTPETPPASVEPPVEPVEGDGESLTEDEIQKFQIVRGDYEIKDNGDGTSTITNPNGETQVFPNNVVRQLINELY